MWRWRTVNTRVGLALVVAAIAGGSSGCGSSGSASDANRMPGPDAAGDNRGSSDGAAADRPDTRLDGDDARSDTGPPVPDGARPDTPADANVETHDAADASDAAIG